MNVSPTRGATVAVIVAFVVGLAGPAAARDVAHKLDGSTIKTNSLPGNRIKSNSVTGKQIAESTLGHVPYATKAGSATTAGTAAKLPPLVWHPLSLINGWTANSGQRTPAYAVDADGIVHLQGQISGGSNNQPFDLPAGARPSIGEVDIPIASQGPAMSDLVVGFAGVVLIQNGVGANATNFTSLDGVTFATD